MGAVTRLLYRRLRPELIVAGGACIGLALAALALARLLDSALHHGGCTEGGDCGLGTLLQLVPYAREALIAAPVICGVAVATSLVAREFEQGTICFAWSTCPNRRRWLVDVHTGGILVVTMLGLAPAFASASISQVLGPQQDAVWSARPLDSDPAIVVISSWVAFTMTAGLSVLVRQSLPALLCGLVVSFLAIGLIEGGFLAWADANAVLIDSSAQGSFYIRSAYVGSDGEVLGPSEAADVAARSGRPLEDMFTPVDLGLSPSTRLYMVVGTIVSELAVAGSTTFVTVALIDRRRLG
jgi:hypothetical protein